MVKDGRKVQIRLQKNLERLYMAFAAETPDDNGDEIWYQIELKPVNISEYDSLPENCKIQIDIPSASAFIDNLHFQGIHGNYVDPLEISALQTKRIREELYKYLPADMVHTFYIHAGFWSRLKWLFFPKRAALSVMRKTVYG